MIDLKDAQKIVLESITQLNAVEIPLSQCDGLVTATPVYATESIPPFDNTAVDGFALRHDDVAKGIREYTILGTIAAGSSITAEMPSGSTYRIMTGAPLPNPADCVLMVEDSNVDETEGVGKLRFEKTPAKFENVREAGSDIKMGQLLFEAQTKLTAGHIGVLASLGMYFVPVYPKAKVGIISTGDELSNEQGPLQPGQIRDSNRPTLSSLVREMGAEPIDFGTVKDDPGDLREVFTKAASSCDVVLSSGGVSVGDFDYTKAILDELSDGTMTWMQIAIRPAKPFAFGHIGTTPVFGLPGNPVSSMVSFELLARPAILKMSGSASWFRSQISAICDQPLRRKPDGKIHFMRVTAKWHEDGRLHIEPQAEQSSHLLYSMANSNALAVVPDGNGIQAGESTKVILLREI